MSIFFRSLSFALVRFVCDLRKWWCVRIWGLCQWVRSSVRCLSVLSARCFAVRLLALLKAHNSPHTSAHTNALTNAHTHTHTHTSWLAGWLAFASPLVLLPNYWPIRSLSLFLPLTNTLASSHSLATLAQASPSVSLLLPLPCTGSECVSRCVCVSAHFARRNKPNPDC